jgi:hypothetical protein
MYHLEVIYIKTFIELSNHTGMFKKEVISEGVYPHPHYPDRFLTITTERMKEWVKAFRTSGLKVWVPHHHSSDTRDNAGWVQDLLLEGGSLYAILKITDEETAQKIREGTIADVSIALEYEYTSQNGEHFPEVIRHIALTLDPHITNQTPFIQLTREVKILEDKETYAYYDEENQRGYIPHHGDDGEPDLDRVLAGLDDLLNLEVSDEVKDKILAHLTRHIKEFLSTAGKTEELERKGLVSKLKALQDEVENLRQKERNSTNLSRVRELLKQGRITPPVARALENLTDDQLQLEHSSSPEKLVSRILDIFEILPSVVNYERLTPSEIPERDKISEEEKEMLKKLGVEKEIYAKYKGR